jgi:uncharacterized protein DUF3883
MENALAPDTGPKNTLIDSLLHASLLCGLRPGGSAANRYQLFFITHHDLHVRNRTMDLQRALETGVDKKGYWENHSGRRSGEYRITLHGYQRASTRFQNVALRYPPSVGDGCSFEFGSTIGDSQLHVVCTAGKFEVFREGRKVQGTRVIQLLKEEFGTHIPGEASNAPRALYDFACQHAWPVRWLGPILQEQDFTEASSGQDIESGGAGQGHERDPAVRMKVEQHAMDLAEAYYRDLGFTVEVTATTKPYDLSCKRGTEEVRVEVKGTQGDGSSVEVTIGEVRNTEGTEWRTDLYVVSGILISKAGGDIIPSGGSARLVEAWRPRSKDLEATRFRCIVPPGRAVT